MSNEAVSKQNVDNDGRLMGMLSIVAAFGALLVNPAMFALLAFFFALMGLTVASPKNRIFSIIGVAAAVVCGVVGHFFITTVI